MTERIKPVWEHGKVHPDSPNKTFCTAPWVHTYISPQSERRLCCASREEHVFQKQYIDATNDEKYGEVRDSGTADDYRPVSLETHWNSDYMKDIRVKLLRGEKIPQCDVCNDSILSQSTYRQWFTGHLFNHKIDEIYANTSEDGHYEPLPISYDYRVSNLCNFKCRMCGEQLSSSWEAEKRKHDLWDAKNQPFMVPETKAKIQKFQREVVEAEFWQAACAGIIEELYWVGGEPLMYDIHWRIMDRLEQDGNLDKVHLRYNSNLSRVRYGDHYLYDWLPKAKGWTMCASIDGTGAIGEFIRSGLNWSEWDANFREGVALPHGNDRMIMDLTITGPGMFDLKRFVDYALELDVRIETKRMFAFHPDIVFSPMAWPREILNRIIDDVLAYIKPRITHKQESVVRELEAMKTAPTFQEEWPDRAQEAFFRGRAWQDRIAEIRGREINMRIEDIYEDDPELYAWWTRPQRTSG